jgi:hypothetical protein
MCNISGRSTSVKMCRDPSKWPQFPGDDIFRRADRRDIKTNFISTGNIVSFLCRIDSLTPGIPLRKFSTLTGNDSVFEHGLQPSCKTGSDAKPIRRRVSKPCSDSSRPYGSALSTSLVRNLSFFCHDSSLHRTNEHGTADSARVYPRDPFQRDQITIERHSLRITGISI